MKTTVKLLALLFLFTLGVNGLFAQDKEVMEVKIKTSAQSDACKMNIEKALAYEAGVVSSNLNLNTKFVNVKYKSHKTNHEKLRVAISKVGYDADGIKANQRAYDRLPAGCKAHVHSDSCSHGDEKKVEPAKELKCNHNHETEPKCNHDKEPKCPKAEVKKCCAKKDSTKCVEKKEEQHQHDHGHKCNHKH